MTQGEKRPIILIIEDDLDLCEMLNAYFSTQGYQVETIAWGVKAVDAAGDLLPDLIVLDIHLPDIDGYEVCKRLQTSHKTRAIPVIFLTERNTKVDKLQGLELGVIDYITKPFDIHELRLRVRNALQRAELSNREHPVTGLPDFQEVDKVLQEIVDGKHAKTGLVIATLRGLNTFRELYGFVASDDVLRVTAMTLAAAVKEIGGDDPFIGHFSDHSFLMLLPRKKIPALESRIIERIGTHLDFFYPAKNRGPNAPTKDRLRLLIGQLTFLFEPPSDLDSLKDQLLKSRRELMREPG